jgi:hypothetical protein
MIKGYFVTANSHRPKRLYAIGIYAVLEKQDKYHQAMVKVNV